MRYSGDPRFLIARFPGVDVYGAPFPKGARVLYYPNGRTFLQGKEAEQAYRDHCAAVQDEQFMTGRY